MLQESFDTIDVEFPDSSSESEIGSIPSCWLNIIDEILATLDACDARSSRSPQDERNVTEMIKCFNNQAYPFKNTIEYIFEWWDK